LTLLIDGLLDRPHDGVRTTVGAVGDDSAGGDHVAAGNRIIADRSAIRGIDRPSRSTDQSGRQNRQHPQPFHFPYSLLTTLVVLDAASGLPVGGGPVHETP